MSLSFQPPIAIVQGLLGLLMAFLSLFLILLVLVQRGKGGGLAGALGGPGGQSAFGSKAGDTFTWITVAVATVWGFVCAFTMWYLGTHSVVADDGPALVDPTPNDAPIVPDPDAADVDGIGSLGSIGDLIPADEDASGEPNADGPNADGPTAGDDVVKETGNDDADTE